VRLQKMRNPIENALDKVIDSKIEKFLGKMMMEQMINDIPPASPPQCATIGRLGAKILPLAKKKRSSGRYIVKALDWRQNGEPIINAVCLPDGYFFVSASLMDLLGDDKDALAFVIGHECGHHVDKDAIKKIRLMLVTWPGRLVLKKFVAKFVDIPLSRRDEFQADKLGVKFNQSAGFDPRGGFVV
jgi:Zn-dependent protease with chaperone function